LKEYDCFSTKNDKYEVEDFIAKFLCLISGYYKNDINKDLEAMLSKEKNNDQYVDYVRKILAAFKNVRELLGYD
jgi:hypothetical protein